MTEDVGTRFARDTADHRMTVLHDDGLYRHLRFRSEANSFYWFDLITVPGSLIFRGDGQSFVFARLTDMFEFFRGPVGRINPGYWAEKLTSSREDGVTKYDEEIFEARVKELVAEAIEYGDGLEGLAADVQTEVFESGYLADEPEARRLLENYQFYKVGADRYSGGMRRVDGVMTYVARKRPDFEFTEVWEMNFRDYDWWFLWACHAIVWGIASYDAGQPVKFEALAKAAAPSADADTWRELVEQTPRRVKATRVETVPAVGGVL